MTTTQKVLLSQKLHLKAVWIMIEWQPADGQIHFHVLENFILH